MFSKGGMAAVAAAAFVSGLATVSWADSLDDKRKTLESLRAEVTSAASPLLVAGADVQFVFPYNPLVAAVQKLNALPAAQRAIAVRSTAANGKFWEDGPTWCNSFLELQGPGDLQAAVDMSNFALAPQADGSLNFSLRAAVDMSVVTHWHFMGKRYNIYVAGVKVGNACPPGGGFGGTVGATGQTTADVTANLRFAQSATTGALRYGLTRVAPDKVSMTIGVGFQHIGTLGIPMDLAVPGGELVSGEIPLVFGQAGTFTLPGGEQKTYAAKLTPAAFAASASGVTAGWTASIDVK